ncbi:MAG: hypothetical protein A2X36_11055 [Elusimicrobia bacterium GWA2_69_24]|nr:MAG: hypothetical protein A2X36_11055 [Elusimicrobia bacterium GWA2_69_24]
MSIKKISVVGSGQMGGGIAHVFALSGFDVTLIDVSQELVDRGLGVIRSNMDRQVKKETIRPEDRDAALGRLKTSPRADRFIGMHFMNPVPLMKLVELIRGVETSDETYATVRAVIEKLGKTPAPARQPAGVR